MDIVRIRVENFRGIFYADVHLEGHTVLVGENNAGKSTLLEAIDLVLGPERLARRPVVDEHDFYAGLYVQAEKGSVVPVAVEVVVAGLSEEQQRHFRDHLEWWDTKTKTFLTGPPTGGTDDDSTRAALRVFFNGWYDVEEDDFSGETYYAHPEQSDGSYLRFSTRDKRQCGFLFLRTLRTGSRALSLERGSLLDIILRLQDERLGMWEELLGKLRQLAVGENEQIGTLLRAVSEATRQYVVTDSADFPHMRVSDLTREMLRRTLTVFMGTGVKGADGKLHAAPYQHQGTGTINMLVLALLSIIAELRQNVIFAMEEPEIALPPHTQKRIINLVRQKSAQAIFTSHSPYVLEEFEPRQILVLRREGGLLMTSPASYPPTVKPKAYKSEFRKRFCEAILAKYVLLVEGRTEFDAFPQAARRLSELRSRRYKSLEHLGVAIVDTQGQGNVAPLGTFFRGLGKVVFAAFDKQSADELTKIVAAVNHPYESQTKGFEDLILTDTSESALRAYSAALVADKQWPPHLTALTPNVAMDVVALRNALREYFGWSKGGGTAGDLLASCASSTDIPQYIRDTLHAIMQVVEPPLTASSVAMPVGTDDAFAVTDAVPSIATRAATPATGPAVTAPAPANVTAAVVKFIPRPPTYFS